MLQFEELKQKMEEYAPALKDLSEALGLDAIQEEIKKLDEEASVPGFWDDAKNSQRVLQRSSMLKGKLNACLLYTSLCIGGM